MRGLIASSFVVLSLGFVISSCDLLDMPKKMDDMNSTTQGLASTSDQMNKKMDETNAGMANSNEVLRLSILDAAFKDMYDKLATENLSPSPFGLMVGGDAFSTHAHEEEIMKWIYLKNKTILETTADDTKRVFVKVLAPQFDNAGNEVFVEQFSVTNGTIVPTIEWDFPIDYITSFNHEKDVDLAALQVIAGFLPQSMIEEMVSKELDNHGLYEQTALLVLNMRDSFIRGSLLQNSLIEDGLKNFEQLNKAYTYVQHLNYIAKSPYADQIKTDIHGFQDLAQNYIYEQQANQSALNVINVVPAPAAGVFSPVIVQYDQDQWANDPYISPLYFTFPHPQPKDPKHPTPQELIDAQFLVLPVDNGKIRTAGLTYSKKAVQKDWKSLVDHYKNMSKDDQALVEAQNILAEAKARDH